MAVTTTTGVEGFTGGVDTTTTTAMVRACAEGSLDDLLRGLLVAGDLEGTSLSTLTVPQVAVDQAAGAGHIKVLDWLWEKSEGTVHPSATGLQMAAAAGKIDTLEWAHARNLEGFGPELMDVAAWQGRLPVLNWLRANRKEGCTANSVNWAAKRGHLNVLRWLRDNLGQACTAEGLEAASTAGHLKVVAWILGNRPPWRGFDTKEAIVGAASNGHAEVLKLLLPGFREEQQQQQQQQQSKWALSLAADGGYTECVALLRKAGWRDGHAPSLGVLPGKIDQDVAAAVGSDSKDYGYDKETNNTNNNTTNNTTNTTNNSHNNNDSTKNDPTSSCRTLASTARGDQEDASNKRDTRLYHDPLASNTIDHHYIPTAHTQFSSAIGEGTHPPRGHVLLHSCYKRGNDGFPRAPEAPWHWDDGLHDSDTRGNNVFAIAPEAPWHRDNEMHDYYKRGSGGFAIAPEAWLGDDGFAKATEALDAGEKVRVRDIWTPVSAAAPPPFRGLGARLNLGGLNKESQDPVISAYINGLDRRLKASALALARRRHLIAGSVLGHTTCTTKGGTEKEGGVYRKTFRTRGLKPFHPVVVEPNGGHGGPLHPFPPMGLLPPCSPERSPTTPMLLSKCIQRQEQQKQQQQQEQQQEQQHQHQHQHQHHQHQHHQHHQHQHHQHHQYQHRHHQHQHQQHKQHQHHHHQQRQHQHHQHHHQQQRDRQRQAHCNHREQTRDPTAPVRPTPPAHPNPNHKRSRRTSTAPQTTSAGFFLPKAGQRAGTAPQNWAGVFDKEARQRAGTAPARPRSPPSGYSRSRRLLLLQASAKEAGLV